MYLKLVSNIIFEIVLSTSAKDLQGFLALWKGVIVLKEKGTRKCIEIFFYNLKQLPFFNCNESFWNVLCTCCFFLLFTYWIHISFNETDSNK